MKRWVTAGLLTAAATAAAQDGGSPSDRVLRGIEACRHIAAAEQRLACFDQSAAALAQAVATRQVRIVDRGDVAKARRSLFGFAAPALDLLDGGTDNRQAADFTEINTTVQSAGETENGRVRIVLADEGNPVWQTTDPMNFAPHAGAKVRIRKGALGNFFLNVDGRTYRAMRLR